MKAENNGRTAAVLAGSLLNRYIVKPLADWRARQVAMEELMSLDDHMLADIGITRGEIPGIVSGMLRPGRAANEDMPRRVANERLPRRVA